MIWNYNGNQNFYGIRKLRDKICPELASKRRKLLSQLASEGSFRCYWFSEVRIISSNDDIEKAMEFLTNLQIAALTDAYPDLTEDPFTDMLLDFVLKHRGVFPNEEDLKQMYGEAEAVRLAGPEKREASSVSPFQLLCIECLQMVIRIMEAAYVAPSRLVKDTETYDYMYVTGEQTSAKFVWDFEHYHHTNADYSVVFALKGDNLRKIRLDDSDDENPTRYTVIYPLGTTRSEPENKYVLRAIIALHKDLCKMATDFGLEYLSEIEDYSKISL